MNALNVRVPTPEGEIQVITKTRFFLFFNRPRTCVIPEGRQLGFQARYNTSDPKTLTELHEFFVALVVAGGFQPYLIGIKTGFFEMPPDFKLLERFIVGFNA